MAIPVRPGGSDHRIVVSVLASHRRNDSPISSESGSAAGSLGVPGADGMFSSTRANATPAAPTRTGDRALSGTAARPYHEANAQGLPAFSYALPDREAISSRTNSSTHRSLAMSLVHHMRTEPRLFEQATNCTALSACRAWSSTARATPRSEYRRPGESSGNIGQFTLHRGIARDDRLAGFTTQVGHCGQSDFCRAHQ